MIASLVVVGGAIAWRLLVVQHAPATIVIDVRNPLNALLERRGTAPPRPVSNDLSDPPPLLRETLDEATAKIFFPAIGNGRFVYDPLLGFRIASSLAVRQRFQEHPDGGWLVRTNSLGMREDAEPSLTRPDLRILVAGASNVEGMCANAESATNRLEAALCDRMPGKSVEALNAGVGASNLYNDLPVLERYRELAPHAFVVIVHGGTDFSNCLALERYFDRRGPWTHTTGSCAAAATSQDPFVRLLPGTELGTVALMKAAPDQVEIAIGFARSVTAEMQRVCAAASIRLICVYLPPPLMGQPELLLRERAESKALLSFTDEEIAVSDRLADGWLEFVRARGIESVDLRPTFRASRERLYWRTDTHLNLAGQRVVADALLPLFGGN